MTKMTTEEAFVKVLQMHGIEHAFGIIGSAFMPISDIFPDAGITFWDVAHETNGGLIADGYTRATGKMSMVIAQNGPGITGLVTPITTPAPDKITGNFAFESSSAAFLIASTPPACLSNLTIGGKSISIT